MTETDADHDDAGDAPAERPDRTGVTGSGGDTFGVGIHVTETEFQFVVHVPSDVDAGWTDPEAFQQLLEQTVWERLDQEATLRAVAHRAGTGDTVTLGRVTLRPDGTVTNVAFRDVAVES
ncbi:MAG: hypothetical protein ABEI27_10255 [Halobellus sp.]|uniref:hypothetical protein n=1 Tax=Halobellus sp. TaxID=1979212 RepID=UPI0035D4AAD3